MRTPIHALVVAGGAAGLGWEVLWQLRSSIALGASATGAALTLAVTMAGLAIGALLAGAALQRAPVSRPLRVYGTIEGIVGLCGLAMPAGFRLVEALDARWALTAGAWIHLIGIAAILGPPTLAMGASIPTIGLVARRHGASLAALYGSNTFGAAVGAPSAIAFVAMPLLGAWGGWLRDRRGQLGRLRDRVGLSSVSFARSVVLARTIGPARTDCPPPPPVPHRRHPSPPPPASPPSPSRSPGSGPSDLPSSAPPPPSPSSSPLSSPPSPSAPASPRPAGDRSAGSWPHRASPSSPRRPRRADGRDQPGVLRVDLGELARPDLPRDRPAHWPCSASPCPACSPPSGARRGGEPCTRRTRRGRFAVRSSPLGSACRRSGSCVGRGSWGLCSRSWGERSGAGGRGSRRRVGSSWGCALRWGVDRGSATIASWGSPVRPGVRLVATREAPDHTVSVVDSPAGRRLFIDGFEATADRAAADYMVWMGRLPALLHPDPQRGLVICFGTGTTANAVVQEGIRVARHRRHQRGSVRDGAPVRGQRGGCSTMSASPRTTWTAAPGLRRADRRYDVVTLEPMPPTFAGGQRPVLPRVLRAGRGAAPPRWHPRSVAPVPPRRSGTGRGHRRDDPGGLPRHGAVGPPRHRHRDPARPRARRGSPPRRPLARPRPRSAGPDPSRRRDRRRPGPPIATAPPGSPPSARS